MISESDLQAAIASLNTDDAGDRRRASDQLLAFGVQAVPALLQALENGPPNARKSSAYLLSAIKAEEESLHPLCRALEVDTEPKVRQNAAVSLGKFGRPEAVPTLVGALEREDVGYVRASLILALGALGGEEAHAALERFSPSEACETEALRKALDRFHSHRPECEWNSVGASKLKVTLRTPPGLEEVAKREAEGEGWVLHPSTRPGELMCPSDFPVWNAIPTLRCVYHPVIRAGVAPPIDLMSPDAGEAVEDLLRQSEPLSEWREWIVTEEAHLTYRFSVVNRINKKVYINLLNVVRFCLSPRGLMDSPSNYSVGLELSADIQSSRLEISPRFTKDSRFSYRKRDVGASIDPVVGACLARLAYESRLVSPSSKNTGVIFDPTCGSGTLLIERALLESDSQLIGMDVSPRAIAAARENVKAAGLEHRIQIVSGNAEDMKNWPVCREVLANLPFGGRTEHAELNLPRLYSKIIGGISRSLEAEGCAVVYTTQRRIMEDALKRFGKGLALENRIQVSSGGLHPEMWVLKSSTPAKR